MIKTKKTAKIFAVVAIALLIALTAMLFMAFGEEAKADEIESGDALENDVVETDESGNWFTRNWKSLVEILTGSAALAVVTAILKFFGKIAKLRNELKTTNTDNKDLKKAFNDMADEVEEQKNKLESVLKAIRELIENVAVSGDKSAAVLAILERLICSSDLPSETKTALQREINKADGAEVKGNDEE